MAAAVTGCSGSGSAKETSAPETTTEAAAETKEETKEETAPEQDAEQEVWDACAQKEDGDEE